MNDTHLITSQVEKYINFKRSLGYLIKVESQELRRFAKFARENNHQGSLTIDLVLNWASEKPHYTRWYRARRLETVHTFAKFAFAIDGNTQIPPTGVFGKCHGRVVPYIFSNDEVILLMDQVKKLLSPDGLRAKAITTAIGLLWATGMRVCELCRLIRNDINFNSMEIHIRDTKFHKERYIPIHKTVATALKQYVKFRDNLYPNSDSSNFFLTTGGRVLTRRHLEYSFKVLRQHLLPNGKNCWDRRAPRLYDLRHTFACNTIIRWYKEDVDINHNIFLLSTYLGHVKPSDTYWYLTGTPELLAIATKKFESFSRGFGLEENHEK